METTVNQIRKHKTEENGTLETRRVDVVMEVASDSVGWTEINQLGEHTVKFVPGEDGVFTLFEHELPSDTIRLQGGHGVIEAVLTDAAEIVEDEGYEVSLSP